MEPRRSGRNLRTPQKDSNRSASESDPENESGSENHSSVSHASGSLSHCSESPGSASFEVRNRSTVSSPGSGEGPGSESPQRTPKSGRKIHSSPLAASPSVAASPLAASPLATSPLAYGRERGRLYPDLGGVSPSTRYPHSPKTPRTPRSPKAPEPECQEWHLNWKFFIFAAVVGSALAVLWMILLPAGETTRQMGTQTPNLKEVARNTFSLGSKKLTAAFPSQTDNFWATINAAVKSIMHQNLEALQPAVIMITCVKGTCPLADCIATNLAQTVTEAYKSEPYLDLNVTSDLLSLRADDAKMKIDDDLRAHLQYGSRSVILRNLHDLQGGAAMILHGFCDNENAPFKEAVLIFTLELSSNVAINTPIGLNNAIETTLTKSWGKALDTNNLSALYSRLINSPVFVKSESVEVYQKHCPQI